MGRLTDRFVSRRVCRYQTTVAAGTIFQATKLPLTRWFLAMHLLTQAKNNVAALELMRHLDVSYKTAWLMKLKLLQVMTERESSRVLEGRVEIDDAYLGGERPGRRGRGSGNKVSFVAAVQTTEDGKPVVAYFVRIPFTKQAIEAWAKKAACRSSAVRRTGMRPGRHCQRRYALRHYYERRHGSGSGATPGIPRREYRAGQSEI